MYVGIEGMRAYQESQKTKKSNGIYNGIPTSPSIFGIPKDGVKYIVSITDDLDFDNRKK